MGGVAVTAMESQSHLACSSVFKLSFRGLPVKSDVAAKPEEIHHAAADSK